MTGLLLRLLISSFGLWLAATLVPGIRIDGVGSLLLAAVLLGIANAIVRPIVILLTLPFTVLTLGLFILVINAAMFGLVAAMLENFVVDGFFSALFGATIVGLTSWVAAWYIGPSGRIEVLVIRQERRT